MVRNAAVLRLLMVAVVIHGCASEPLYRARRRSEKGSKGCVQVGWASYYGPEFHGEPTASGERFDMYELTAAHTTLPFGTRIKVTNLENGRSVIVRVNDRGPFMEGRVLDLSYGAALKIEMVPGGTTKVRIEVLGCVP